MLVCAPTHEHFETHYISHYRSLAGLENCYVDQGGLEITETCLPLAPRCWDSSEELRATKSTEHRVYKTNVFRMSEKSHMAKLNRN